MAHELYTDGTNYAAAVARTMAWHQLGSFVADDDMSVDEALRLAYLADWNVRKVPLLASVDTDAGNQLVEIDIQFGVVHDSPFDGQPRALGVVGNYYTPIQNEESFAVLQQLVDENDLRIETAGALRNGSQTFVTMRVPEPMMIGGADPVDLFITALNSHNGSIPFTLLVSPVRVVCANTMNAALRNQHGSYKIRHTEGSAVKVAEARDALNLSFKYLDAFEVEAERMIAAQLTTDEFRRIVAAEFGPTPDDSDRITANKEKRVNEFVDLFLNSPTNADIRGTRWAGYHVFTEYHDHYSTVRGTNATMTRALRTLADTTVSVKERAFDLFRVPVSA